MRAEPLPPFKTSIRSTDLEIRDALAALRAALQPLDLDSDELGTVELVLAEVLNNIVEHAYPEPDNAAGTIAITGTHKSDGLHLQIRDNGLPMPDGQTPLGSPVDVSLDLDDLPEGGFGWFLIKNLAKDVTYVRRDGENHLDLRLAVGLLA
ncbi:MAG: ATP-binding protein [Pseudomonadota bacterium]